MPDLRHEKTLRTAASHDRAPRRLEDHPQQNRKMGRTWMDLHGRPATVPASLRRVIAGGGEGRAVGAGQGGDRGTQKARNPLGEP